MRLLVQQSILNDNYTFTFSVDPASISSDDSALFQKYGPQIVNFGATTATTYTPAPYSSGTFGIYVYGSYNATTSLGVGTSTDSFVLPDYYVNFPTNFPIQQTFTSISPSIFSSNTTNRLLAYRQYVQAQVYSMITGLRAQSDSFTGEFITNI